MSLLRNYDFSRQSVLFYICIIKLLFSGFFSSDLVENSFLPFMQQYFEQGYDAWKMNDGNFTYPPLMAIVLFVPVKLMLLFSSVYLQNLIFHLPILFADLIIVKVLNTLLPGRHKEILFYYICSPILLYASYIYSQLDIIPTAMIFLSSLLLVRGKFRLSFLLLGVSIALKWHTIVALPLYVIYLTKKDFVPYRNIVLSIVLTFIPMSLSLLPFGGLAEMLVVFGTNEKSLIFNSYLGVMDLKLYLFPSLYLIIIGRSFAYSKINVELFMGLLAIIFMTFVVVVYPNPGWFIWSLPFLSYSFVKNNRKKKMILGLYSLISIIYILFFVFFYIHPSNGISNLLVLGHKVNFIFDSPTLRSLIFTTLVGVMFLGIYAIYKSAIQNSLIYKRRFQSFLVGIAGDSGAGKSTLLKSMQKVMNTNILTTLEGDGEHKWERGDENWSKMTHLNPHANELHQQLLHLIRLKYGKVTYRSDYNHSTGKFDKAKKLKSKDFIALAGLHPFYLKGARDNIDLKIFVDTDEELRKHWKIVRDTSKRGYSIDKILAQLDSREKDSRKYIHPQKKYADLLISYRSDIPIEIGKTSITDKDLIVEYKVDIDVSVDKLLKFLDQNNVEILSHDFDDELIRQIMTLKVPIDFEAKKFETNFSELFQAVEVKDVEWERGIGGMNQIFILHSIENKYIGMDNAK